MYGEKKPSTKDVKTLFHSVAANKVAKEKGREKPQQEVVYGAQDEFWSHSASLFEQQWP